MSPGFHSAKMIAGASTGICNIFLGQIALIPNRLNSLTNFGVINFYRHGNHPLRFF